MERPARSFRRIKLLARISVVDRKNKSTRQLFGDVLDPVKRCEVDFGFVLIISGQRDSFEIRAQWLVIDWLSDKNKIVAGIRDKLFLPCTAGTAGDKTHRHRVQQLVGKMDAGEQFEIGD